MSASTHSIQEDKQGDDKEEEKETITKDTSSISEPISKGREDFCATPINTRRDTIEETL